MSKAALALQGLMPHLVNEDVRAPFMRVAQWMNDADVTGTNAVAERPIFRAKRPCRVRAASIVAAAAVTAHGTNYWTLLIDKRTAAAPGTPVNVLTFAADTPTTDDLAAFDDKDLSANLTTTAADLALAVGDVLTVEITKAGAGLTFPVATVALEVLEGTE